MENQKALNLDELPADFLFHYSCGRLKKEMPKMHFGTLRELKEGYTELGQHLDVQFMKFPEELREAVGITMIDVEEVKSTK